MARVVSVVGRVVKVYLRLDEEMSQRFTRIKGHLGVRNDTEVLRSLINYYWRENREELLPRLEQFNLSPEGVMVLDRDLQSVVQVHFKPEGVACERCGRGCRHVEFALSLPEVQEVLRKRGWLHEEGRHHG